MITRMSIRRNKSTGVWEIYSLESGCPTLKTFAQLSEAREYIRLAERAKAEAERAERVAWEKAQPL